MIKAYKVQITGIISITDRGTHPENWGLFAIYDVLKDGAIDLQITELVEPEAAVEPRAQRDHDRAMELEDQRSDNLVDLLVALEHDHSIPHGHRDDDDDDDDDEDQP